MIVDHSVQSPSWTWSGCFPFVWRQSFAQGNRRTWVEDKSLIYAGASGDPGGFNNFW